LKAKCTMHYAISVWVIALLSKHNCFLKSFRELSKQNVLSACLSGVEMARPSRVGNAYTLNMSST
jgi:hypothetical protein